MKKNVAMAGFFVWLVKFEKRGKMPGLCFSHGKSTFKWNSSGYKKCEYVHLGS